MSCGFNGHSKQTMLDSTWHTPGICVPVGTLVLISKVMEVTRHPFLPLEGVVPDKRAQFGDKECNSKHITSQGYELMETVEKLLGQFYNKRIH